MIARILYVFGYLLFGWAFFVSSLSMELRPTLPIIAATILFMKLIFMAAAVLYSAMAFSTLLSVESEKE